MAHETPLSSIVFQKPNGETGELELHDSESLHGISDGSITADKIAADAITSEKIADGAVNMEHIADGSISEDKLSRELKEAWDSQSQAMRAGTVVGSKVVTLNSQGTACLMTDAELEAAIGRRFDVARGDCCVVMDGDMGSVTVPISTHYSQTMGGVWAHFNGAKDALVRCNWAILYRL